MSHKHSWILLPLLLALSLLAPQDSFGHAKGENYIFFNFRDAKIDGWFEFHERDLKGKMGIDIDFEASDIEETIASTAPKVQEYIRKNFQMGPVDGEPWEIKFTTHEKLEKGKWAQYYFEVDTGPMPDKISFKHELCYEDDRMHRGLLLVRFNSKDGKDYGEEYTALVFSSGNPEQVLDLNNIPSVMMPAEMIWQGVLHIWIGIDHILFLVALMLPVVLIRDREKKVFTPASNFKSVLWRLLKIITVFTIAHSITLGLAALGYINISSRLVESIIALSIILVAINNIMGTVRGGSLTIIFFLGLFHGLGFATVMGHLPFRMSDLTWTIVNFNVGVELGQVAIVAVLFPILYAIRKSSSYVPVVLKGGSVILAIIATLWFIERAFDLDLNLPF